MSTVLGASPLLSQVKDLAFILWNSSIWNEYWSCNRMRRLFQDSTSLRPRPRLLLPPCLSSRDSIKFKSPPMIHRAGGRG
uniref:Uncharacterized protein n=1 Tax=Physcomitrium patens TaxID=3218 RepID=A0A7I3ZQT8_PHYPA